MTRPAKSYYRVMLGRQGVHAAECLADGFIGVGFGFGFGTEQEQVLPHRRRVNWLPVAIARTALVGQILRYMGYVKKQIAETHQTVEGVIIALDDDQKLRWALLAVPGISFYRHQVSFKLIKH